MNIAIIGYGKMGKIIAQMAKDRGHNISLTIDKDNISDLNGENLKSIDVAIEFSSPATAFDNIMTCLHHGTPVVSGTTGWLDRWDRIEEACKKNGGAVFYASNFSIGVNILFSINQKLAGIMNSYPEYDVKMKELHHIHKLDEPSGTAITLAEQIEEQVDAKNGWSLENENGKINILAEREGEVNGFHEVIYDSEIDTIKISHNAKSRKGFAGGAVMAAEYINGKSGIFSMKEMLNL